MYKFLLSVVAVISAAPVFAEPIDKPLEFSFRGGVSASGSDYPYALASTGFVSVGSILTSDFGYGGFAAVALTHDSLFGQFGGEIGLSYLQVEGDEAYSIDSGLGDCNLGSPGVFDVITLSHRECMDGADTDSKTTLTQMRAVLTHAYADSSLQVLAGLGYFDFSSNSTGQMYYPGETSSQQRNASFEGMGVVIGARKELDQPFGSYRLKLEGLAGAYWGDRDLRIVDEYVGINGFLDSSRGGTAYTIEVTASFLKDTAWPGPESQFEWGATYVHAFDVMDTANRNAVVIDRFGAPAQSGSTKDDFGALSLFAGLKVRF
ncbi:MAG TPA: hypothetical protein VIN05_01500 [Roseovarius sp.]